MTKSPIYTHSQAVNHLTQIVADSQSEHGIRVPLVAVYCGARSGNDTIYTQTAYQLGQALAQANLGLVYGGACIGVMGAVADGVLSQRGTAVGVIPEFLLDRELAHEGLDVLQITDTMHTRKALMAEYASAFVVLAGGFGTLEEIMEIATWRQLYRHEKPMLIVNTAGFYDGLMAHLRHTVKEGFMSATDLERLVVCPSVEEAMAHLMALVQVDSQLDVAKF